jgi:hypothetical protein
MRFTVRLSHFTNAGPTRLATFIVPALLGAVLAPAWAEEAVGETLPPAFPGGKFALKQNDVVAFLGGEAVAQEAELGHFESILAVQFPKLGVRYRNLAWEGDTVFEQPRDLNFPTIPEQLQRVGATVIVAQFGRMESLAGREGLERFVAAYEKLCDEWAKQTPRVMLVTPPPFEEPDDPAFPDLSARNGDLRLYAEATRALAERRGFLCLDLFSVFADGAGSGLSLTSDGLHITPEGNSLVALFAARTLELEPAAGWACGAGAPGWPHSRTEAVRQAVIAKNKLWFDYWRPMNWAFLAGERATVAASFDHSEPGVRWFPTEMEKFVPLIEQAEARVEAWADFERAAPEELDKDAPEKSDP